MSARVRVERAASGELVARKRGLDAEDDRRLEHEASVLQRARHPGVVELRALEEVEGRVELVTAWVGTRSLADRVPLPPSEAAGLLAATAEIVADLHGLGIVHGGLDPTQVLLDQGGRPVLCGFGADGVPSDDVADLGRMLQVALGAGDEVDPIPERRFGRGARVAAFTRRALLNLADQATADDPTCRPSARSFARALTAAAPAATLPALVAAGDEQPASRPQPADAGDDPFAALRASRVEPDVGRRRWAPWLVGAAVAVFVAVALLGGSGGDGHSEASANAPSVTAAGPATTPGAAAATSTVVASGTGPPVVERDGAHYAVGEAGDQVEVGDWDCSGRPTVALLRPRTGEIFVFTAWAEPGRDLVARPVVQVTPGAHLDPTDRDADGCAVLLATQTDGTTVPVPLPEARP